MNRTFRIFAAGLLIGLAVLVLLLVIAQLRGAGEVSSAPCLNNGHKWQIGTVQSGDYSYSHEHLIALIDGLVKTGWIKRCDWRKLPKNVNSRQLWEYITENVVSDYLVFKRDAFWSSEWKFNERQQNRKRILRRLNLDRDLDLIIASGLWSGDDLSSNLHRTPVLIISSLNPLDYGSLQERWFSFNHIFLRYDPDFILRQIRMFQIITGFRRLGVIYDPSPEGRVLSNLPLLEKYAKEMNFSLIALPVKQYNVKQIESAAKLREGFEQLAEQVDAVWVTTFADEETLANIIEPLNEHKLPSWSPYGIKFVEAGVIMSMKAVPRDHGLDYAKTFGMILNGADPRRVETAINNKYELVLNLAAARKADFKLPKGIVLSTDNTYLQIKRK